MQPPLLAQPPPAVQPRPPQVNGGKGPKPRGRRKKIRTEPIRPICPQCEKQFSNQSALTKHKLTHSDERKFACPQCSKAFKRHDHLTGHMQTHSNRKPFTCNIQGCDKTYCDARSLRRHKENIHHIVTPRDNNNSSNNSSTNINSTTSIHSNYLHHHHTHHPHHTNHNHNSHHHHTHTHHPHQNHHQHHHHLQHLNINSNKLTNQHERITHNKHEDDDDDNNNNNNIIINHDMNTTLTLLSNGTEQTSINNKNEINQTPQTPTYQVDNTVTSSTLPSNCTTSTDHSPPVTQQLIQSPTIYSSSPNTVANPIDGNNNTMDYCNLNNTTTNNSDLPLPTQQQQQQPTSQQTTHQTQQSTSLQHQEPSHLLRRRIQRLHSDQSGTYSCNVDQLACFTVQPHSLGPPPPLTQPNGNSNSQHHQHQNHHNQYLNNNHNSNNHHHMQHASFSADYASTQQFNFDFAHMNTHHSGSHQHLSNQADHHLGHPHTGPLEHTLSTGSVPHSADSVTDSGLGLNMHYEQHTPQPLPLSLPPPRYNHQLSHQQQQHHQQAAVAAQQQHHISYSAGYAAPQHFDFDINNIQSNNSAHHHQQQAPASAQPSQQSASTFDFAPMNTNQQQSHHHQQSSLEHTLSTGTLSVPHSADSVTDSGLSLNVHYEQHTPQPLGPPSYHQQHQVSYSAGYATTQRFDFDFNNNSTLQARGIES